MNDNGMTPSDVRAVVDASNSGYPLMPYPYMGGSGFGNSFGSGDWSWILLLIILCGGFNNGFGGGFGGFGGGFGNEYAWLSNGQKEIMQNTNNGFDTLQLSNQLNNLNTGVQGISTQICNSTADINSNICNGFAGVNATVNSGFANAETAANSRQMANMNQAFNSQISTLNGFNNLNNALQQCLTKIFDKAKKILSFNQYKAVGTLVG